MKINNINNNIILKSIHWCHIFPLSRETPSPVFSSNFLTWSRNSCCIKSLSSEVGSFKLKCFHCTLSWVTTRLCSVDYLCLRMCMGSTTISSSSSTCIKITCVIMYSSYYYHYSIKIYNLYVTCMPFQLVTCLGS